MVAATMKSISFQVMACYPHNVIVLITDITDMNY
jgi:hypothetical protein